VVLGAAPAGATFPGRDGRLAVQTTVPRIEYPPLDRPRDTSIHRIVILKRDGSARRTLEHCESLECVVSPAAWSPSGDRIAWSVDGETFTSPFRPFMVDARPGDAAWPTWSPNGRQLLYAARGGLYRARVSGGPEKRVPFGDDFATWCANGTIVLVSSRDRTRLFTYRPGRGGSPREVPTDATGVNYAPIDCSPGSRWVLYRNQLGFWAARIQGPPRTRFIARSDYGGAVWSPSGRHIAWSDGRRVWISRADGSGKRALPRDPELGEYRYPSWQPRPR
jgi:hypothetical protein